MSTANTNHQTNIRVRHSPDGDTPLDEARTGRGKRRRAASKLSESGGEPGRWVRATDRSGAGSPAALSWEPSIRLRERLLRGVSLPAALGSLVFVAALAITAFLTLRSLGSAGDEHPSFAVEPAVTLESEADASGQAGALDDAQRVTVHLVGEVHTPGVFALEAGARVLEAVEAAGGATERADLSALNLARPVSDGEQIRVFDADTAAQLVADGGGIGLAGLPDAPRSSGGGLVNINAASADELTRLPGIGPALAERIVDWREANGRFGDLDQLTQVSGIGVKTLERFRDRAGV